MREIKANVKIPSGTCLVCENYYCCFSFFFCIHWLLVILGSNDFVFESLVVSLPVSQNSQGVHLQWNIFACVTCCNKGDHTPWGNQEAFQDLNVLGGFGGCLKKQGTLLGWILSGSKIKSIHGQLNILPWKWEKWNGTEDVIGEKAMATHVSWERKKLDCFYSISSILVFVFRRNFRGIWLFSYSIMVPRWIDLM